MQYSTLLTALAAFGGAHAAAISARQGTNTGIPFKVTNFAVTGQWPSETTTYSLDVSFNGTSAHCATANSIIQSPPPCSNANPPKGPAEVAGPFNQTSCMTKSGKPSPISWNFFEAMRGQDRSTGFVARLEYDDGSGAAPLYGCSPYILMNYDCTFVGSDPAAPGYATKLQVPKSYNVNATTFQGCIVF